MKQPQPCCTDELLLFRIMNRCLLSSYFRALSQLKSLFRKSRSLWSQTVSNWLFSALFCQFHYGFPIFFFTANKQFVFCSKTYILLIFATFLWRLFIMLFTFILFIFFFTVITICLCHQLPLFSLDACLNPCWSVLRWFPSLSGHSILLHWMCPMVLKCLFQIFPLF